MHSFLKFWAPVILWAVLISLFSTDQFSSSNTSRIIGPLVAWLIPNASPELQETIHHAIRKLGHWTEYFVLAWLVLRGFEGEPKRRLRRHWMAWTLALVLLYALGDELHQAFVPTRSARLADSMVDFLGGFCAVTWKYLRQSRNEEDLGKDEEAF
jgi:VanZ family protein